MESFEEFWNKIVNFFTSNAWNILLFFATLIIGTIVIWLIMTIIKAVFKKRQMDMVASRFICSIIRFVLWLVLVIGILSGMGVPITGLTTAVSAIVLAVGVALKDNISNLANGIIIVSSKKYKTGDYVVVEDVEGSIIEINFLFTALKTPDGKQVLMPNSAMVNSKVINMGAFPTRRVQLTISVAYESDVELVKKTITDVMKSNGKVYLDPAPFCRLKTFGSSSLDFFCKCWVDGEDYWDVYYDLTEGIFNELKRNGIVIPYQQIEIRERKDTPPTIVIEEKRERIEKKRAPKKKKVDVEDWESGEIFKMMAMPKKKKDKAKNNKSDNKEAEENKKL